VTLGRGRPPRRFDCNAVRGPVGAGGARALSKRVVLRTEARAGQLAIDRLNLSGARSITQVVQLGHDVNVFAIALAGRYVYWSDQNAIGRIALDGSRVRQRFIVLPQEQGGGVAEGWPPKAPTCTSPATDSGGWIGRATLNGHDVDGRWLHIHSNQGPFQVTADSAHVY
jgi:hypothetical protein